MILYECANAFNMTDFAVTKADNDGHMLNSKYGNYVNGYLLVYMFKRRRT
jgi:hypothetical protein